MTRMDTVIETFREKPSDIPEQYLAGLENYVPPVDMELSIAIIDDTVALAAIDDESLEKLIAGYIA